MRLALVLHDWLGRGCRSIYATELGIRLSSGDLHSGATWYVYGTATIYGAVQIEGDGEWICRTYYRPLKRKGGVKGPAKPRRELADIEKAMGLAPGRLLAGPWELEEEDWR